MRCSGCGKDIPFAGHVCPYCQRDKSSDQAAHGCIGVALFIGGGLGYAVGGFTGLLTGGIIFGIIAAIASMPQAKKKAKTPPKVVVANLPKTAPKPVEKADSNPTPEERLMRLDTLRANGIINQQEYDEQRKAIISSL
ncbi:SHOCT domain-containing protein [Sphingobium fuliginis]|uniref:SHOCT domain-containing protein n=1 Tax=Sphingobium fuliginis (strain ATCC 27551) TaxID=336203 RepID=UPI0011AF0764|nr:SHOCT domain-containing protein [Sphingobium fuliginis]